MPTPTLTRLFAGAATLLTLLADCSSPSAPNPAPSGAKIAPTLTALFQQTLDERKDTLSDFEKEVIQRAIASGKISATDYQEAINRYAMCMKDAGYEEVFTQQSNGLTSIKPTMPTSGDVNKWVEAYSDKSDACARGNRVIIESLYRDQQGNPDLLTDPVAIIVTCLRKQGVITDTFTAEDLRKWTENPKSVELPFKLNDPKAVECLANGGIAVASAGEQAG